MVTVIASAKSVKDLRVLYNPAVQPLGKSRTSTNSSSQQAFGVSSFYTHMTAGFTWLYWVIMYTRWKQIKAKWDTDIGICGFRSRVLVSHSSSSCSRGYFLHYYGPSAREKHFRVHLSPWFHNRLSLSRWDICCSSCYISSPRFRRSHLWCLWLKTGTELNVLITTFFNQTKTRYWHARPAQNNQITEKQVSKFQECRPWVNRSKCHCQSAHLSGNTFLSCIFMLCFEFFCGGVQRGANIQT